MILKANILLSVFTVLIILFTYFIHIDHWFFGFLGLMVPPLLLLNIGFVLFWLFKNYKVALVSVVPILTGIKPLYGSFAINLPVENPQADFSLMNYNVGTFNLQRFIRKDDTVTCAKVIDWLDKTTNPDIICFQEFYTNDVHDIENTMDEISQRKNLPYYYTNPMFWENYHGFFGVAIFSRFPIINSGALIFGDSIYLNRGVYTDLKIKDDTVRIVNIHLHSMTIRLDTTDNVNILVRPFNNAYNIAKKLKRGFIKHKTEIEHILDFVKTSPYKTIVCGDFNCLPYSYPYRLLNRYLKNTFEESGHGFGFTYNRFPWFIRIDNQFHDPRLKPIEFKVFTDNKYSDHYPVQGWYRLND